MEHSIENSDLQQYKDYAPTAFDTKGLGLASRQDWYVCPVIQTRDSGCFEQSNYSSLLKTIEDIDPNGNDYEEHCFNHWGPGWIEIILVRPNSAAHKKAIEAEFALSDYPVLDDEDLSNREYEDFLESWESWASGDFVEEIIGYRRDSLTEDEIDWLEGADPDQILRVYEEVATDWLYEHSFTEIHINYASAKKVTVEQIKKAMRYC